jgi:hypothetical protein
MKTIKTRSRVKDIKLLDKSVNLGRRMKNSLVQVKERAEETQSPSNDSPTDYASSNIESTAQGVAREGVHILKNPWQKARENWNRAKGHFQEVKRNLPKERRRAANEDQKTARTANNTADKAQETAKDAKTAVKDAKQTLREVRQEGRRTLREVKHGERSEIKANNGGAARTAPTNAPVSPTAASKNWCEEGRIPGAVRFVRVWAIPKDAEKPADARLKSEK